MWIARTTFIALPDFVVQIVAGPLHRNDEEDCCLLTCTEITKLGHAVRGSDGRIYDAIQLKRWLKTCSDNNLPPHVIPGCYIEYVDLNVARASRASCHRLRKILLVSRTKIKKVLMMRKRPPLWSRVLDECKLRRFSRIRKPQPLKLSVHSAFDAW